MFVHGIVHLGLMEGWDVSVRVSWVDACLECPCHSNHDVILSIKKKQCPRDKLKFNSNSSVYSELNSQSIILMIVYIY